MLSGNVKGGIEEDLADDTHRETNHGVVDIDDHAVFPLLHDPLGIGHNGISVGSEVAWLKGRGHQLALPSMELPLADEKAIVVHRFAYELPFAEIAGMLDQDMLGMLGLLEEEHRNGTNAKTHDIPFLC
jgi:hypothetical protein